MGAQCANVYSAPMAVCIRSSGRVYRRRWIRRASSGGSRQPIVATRLSYEAVQITDTTQLGPLLQSINSELCALMTRDLSLVGMGTTVVGLILNDDHLIWFNIGDSRLYRHCDGALSQISIDDVADAPWSKESSYQRRSHIITQCLGGDTVAQRLYPHVGTEVLAVPSRWLLCSDGVTDMIDIDTMAACMDAADLDTVSMLIELAMQAGGEDNISIILVSVCSDVGAESS